MPTAVSSETTTATEPELALVPDGVMAIWIQNDGISNSVFFSVYADNAWSAPDKVEKLPGSAHSPALAANASGVASVAWEVGALGGPPSSGTDEFVSVYRPGSGWGTPAQIDFTIERSPRVGIDDRGRILVVMGALGVYYAQSMDGQNWMKGTALPADPVTPDSQWDLGVAPNGTGLVAWRTGSTGHDLYAQIYRP